MKKFFTLAAALFFAMTMAADDSQPTLVTLPEGVVAEDYTLAITYSVSQQDGYKDTSKEFTTKVAFDGNDVYVSGLAYYFPEAYVKGTLSGSQVTFASGQFLGEDMYGQEYLSSYALSGEDVVISDFVLSYNAQTRVLSYPGDVIVAETSAKNDGVLYAYVKAATFTPGAVVRPEGVSVPDDLTTADFLLMGTYSVYEPNEAGEYVLTTEKYQKPVQVGFSGDDLYLQGLVENVPEAWAKATKNAAGKYVIPMGQYVGTTIVYGETYDYYVAAVNKFGTLENIVFTLDEESQTISTAQTMVVNRNAKTQEAYYWIRDIAIKPIVEKEATPATPEFTFHAEKSPYGSTTWYYANIFVPLVDTEGAPMATDKVSYVFYSLRGTEVSPVVFQHGSGKYYMLEEDMTEIPYGFTDRLDIGLHFVYFEKQGIDELQSWEELGMQTIYRGQGVEHRSDIFWFDLVEFWQTQGITDVLAAPRGNASAPVYNLAGQRQQGLRKGLNIVGGKKIFVR